MPTRTLSASSGVSGEHAALAQSGSGVVAPGLAVALAAIETGWLGVLGFVTYRLATHGRLI